jgi:hypothetical protein
MTRVFMRLHLSVLFFRVYFYYIMLLKNVQNSIHNTETHSTN